MTRTVLIACLVLAGCDGDDDPVLVDGGAGDSGALDPCNAGTMEDDVTIIPFNGAGVDPMTHELRPFASPVIASATYIRIREENRARFNELVAPIMGQLATQEGLVGVSLAISGSCASARTLTIWESSEAMVGFMVSPNHAAAMAASSEVALPGSTVVNWQANTTADASWDEAVERAGAAPPLAIYE